MEGGGMRRFLLRLFLVIPGGEECEIMNEPVRSDFFFVGVAPPRDNRGEIWDYQTEKLITRIERNVISIDSILGLVRSSVPPSWEIETYRTSVTASIY